MRKFFATTLILTLLIFGISPTANALPVNKVSDPRPVGEWVTDQADIISEATETKLNELITDFAAKLGEEILIVTVPETEPELTPRQYATKLFQNWHLGSRNSLIWLVSQADRRVEIKTAPTIIPLLPNSQVKDIIDTKIIPAYKEDNYDQGTIVGTETIIETLTKARPQSITTLSVENPLDLAILISVGLLCLFFFACIFIWLVRNSDISKSNSQGRLYSSYSGSNYSDSSGSGGSDGCGDGGAGGSF